jgi:hypothetical protein
LPGGCAKDLQAASRISSPVSFRLAWPPPKSAGNISWKLAFTASNGFLEELARLAVDALDADSRVSTGLGAGSSACASRKFLRSCGRS